MPGAGAVHRHARGDTLDRFPGDDGFSRSYSLQVGWQKTRSSSEVCARDHAGFLTDASICSPRGARC